MSQSIRRVLGYYELTKDERLDAANRRAAKWERRNARAKKKRRLKREKLFKHVRQF